ncbi:non-ribosomal peptide synthetase [Pseudomonas sp. RIT-To-2]|uniref:non-ribosomal peptide synthetase n=1 Tax=Pseudomonas sp. RIT-To-2 TaxID=3462541 RepID=UPI0024133B1F
MSINELLATLKANDIQLTVKDGQLVVQGNRRALGDHGLVEHLREHKPALIALIEQGAYQPAQRGPAPVPANGIAAGCTRITPAMLSLVSLDQAVIDRLVESVPGGAANVQDIYPLAPLQQGILYHHVSAADADPYVMQVQFAFADRARLEAFAQALRQVIARHDILRTSVHWQGLATPMQVVWRHAELQVGPLPTGTRLDLGQAPLLRLVHGSAVEGPDVKATLLFHHIAMDHSALEVVRQEIQACLQGEGERLGTPVPFRNYVAQALLGVTEQEHQAFFSDMLGDLDEPTLAYDRQDLSGDGESIGEHSLGLDLVLGRRLRAQARSLGVSVASLFHLGWARVLAGLTGRQRVVFGTVLMGRLLGAEATERALGIFINTLPLRLDLEARDVRAAVIATHQRLTALMRHEHAPLALAQSCSGVAAPTPLFNALLNYRHSAGVEAGGETWEGIEVLHAQERSNYPVVMSVDDLGDAFGLTAQAAAGIDPQRLCGYLECAMAQLVEALEQAPHTAVAQLPILPAGERTQLLRSFNAQHSGPASPLALHQRIEEQAARQPRAIAAQAGDQALSYQALNARANSLAHHLIALGVSPDDRVAVVARRGLDTLVGLLAVLKAGAGYVPVDPAHPDERLCYLLDDSQPTAVLTQQALRARLPERGVPVLALDAPSWPEQPHNPQVPGLTLAHLAYVIYTSGSTGQPKGVMVEHHTLNNLVDWHCHAFDLQAGTHTASVAGFGFDAMAWEVWPALCTGATLHLPPAEVGNEQLDALLDWWQAQPLEVAFLPTPVAEYAFSRDLRHPTLRTLLIGGDRLRQFTRDPGFAVINNYGPTEATVVATSGQLLPGGALDIGRPITNTHAYLLDAGQQLVPFGIAGELYVGGAGVARGYLNRPDLSAERFLRDPFSHVPGARMYRTGDLARWNTDGTLEYLGRNDDQVKIRGVRIELGEIEAQFSQLPGIEEALVLAREDQPGQPRLVGYYSERDATPALTVEALRAALQARLPAYMVPSALVRVATWPLTANGKVDRRALPLPDREALHSGEYQAPEGELETALASLWAELLHVPQVGRHDRFFDLGGHSLLAMRMVAHVRERLGIELSLGAVFAQPQLSALAQVLAQAGVGQQPPIVAVARDQALPLSFAQQRLWFLAQMEGGSSAYHIPAGLRLRGRLDQKALTQALDRLVARHESLRTTFVEQGEQGPLQRIASADIGFSLHRVEASEEALAGIAAREAAEPFDLSQGPLVRGRLVRLADDDHVLLLTLHHIIADGWSAAVLTRELGALYQAFCQGAGDPLPALAVQYADYAAWQREWLSGPVLQQQTQYWQQALAGAPALLALPTDRPRPAEQDYRGQRLELALDASLVASLKALSQRQGTTLFMTVLAAWAAVLSRLSGQDEVVIGTPVANRLRAEVQDLIGLFVNTLAIRVEVASTLDVEALLQQVKATTLAAQAHQDLPFEQVVEALRPQRSLAHTPIFQAMLAWQDTGDQVLNLDGLSLESLQTQQRTAKFDVLLEVSEVGEGLHASLEYATALFDEATMQRCLGYLQAQLRGMAADAQARVTAIPLLDADQRQQVLERFNATAVDYPTNLTLHGLFEAQVAANGGAVAVTGEQGSLGYDALNRQANRIAHRLIGLGIGPDDRVAICVDRSLEMVAGLLGILKAGAAYVPLDPDYPQDRLTYMLGNCAPAVVLTQQALRGVLPASDVPVLLLDPEHAERESFLAQPDHNPARAQVRPDHLAYVIYTSGSTGQPKGVMNEHRGVVNRLLWMQDEYGLGASDSVLQKTPFSFDVSVWEFFWPLFNGARLVMARPGGHRDPGYLREVIRDQGITTLHFVPSMLDLFLAHGATDCNGLRRVMCSGEALPGHLVRRFKQQLPEVGLFNLYGPTEAAVDVTAWDCAGPLEQTPDNIPIGKPVANTRMYLLDSHCQPVPPGVAGELYIAGVQVARGYLNRPQLTAERFLDDPFQGGRMYRTGDLGRYLADGNIEYLGRNDDQVKIRGLRIELGEIEAALAACAGVKESVVLAREDNPGEKRLVAYVTAQPSGTMLAIENLRSHLQATLPDYMVPAAYVQLDALPLTPNGKLNRKALPAPDAGALIQRDYEAPEGATETALAPLWAELLKVERVGRHDHFFEQGGHSLLAVTLLARMRQLGLHADIRALFAQPTLAGLAAAVGGQRAVDVPVNLIGPECEHLTPALLPLVALEQPLIDRIVASVPGGVANVQDIYPLGPLQAGILYHHLSAGEHDPYVQQAHFTLADAGRLAAFGQALQQVVARHDILRTALSWEGLAAPVQVVWRQASVPVEAVPLEALAQVPAMDLTQAPLLRLVHATDPATGRITAVLRWHHVVMDHIALDVLGQELQALLADQAQALPAPVPYRNYVAQVLQGPGEASHEAFFREQLADLDEPTLPYGLAMSADAGIPGEARLALPPTLAAHLREQARQHGVSAASLFHLAWAQVLGQLAGRDSVVFGTVLLGRLQGSEGVERAVGVFINTLPLRLDLAGQTVREAVLDTQRRLNELLAHEHAQLALAQRCSGLAAGVPLFSTLFNYRHGAPASTRDATAWAGIELLHAEERSNYPLTLSVDDLGEAFELTAQAASGLDPARLCGYLQQALANLAEALAQQPSTALDHCSVVPEAEREQLLRTFNDSRRDYPREPVHRLFEQQTAAQPQAVAAVHGDESLTYRALNTRANRLAHYLIEQGVQPGDHVAILLPRSLALLVSQLAIAKCGAAYVPLDIHAPAERQGYMILDCQAVAVLSHSATHTELACRRIDLDGLDLSRQPSHDPQPRGSADSVAYVMYTSGSTGAPKGVRVAHRGIARLVLNNGFAPFTASDRFAFASNPAFDASTLETWGALLNGGQVRVIDHDTLVEPGLLGAALRQGEVSVLFLTTALFNQYAHGSPEALASLRVLLTGGERGDPAAFQALLAHAPQVQLMHVYGPTETTTFATACTIAEVPEAAQTLPIGRPIGNTCLYVLDEHRRLAPLGVTGELYIGGDGVALGYLNRPELTAERFLDDPFSEQPQALLYRTGDLGRWLPDGQLECLGRNDDQVKIRGFRIELGEIVSRLHALPGINETVVLARDDEPGPLTLVAYFTVSPGAEALAPAQMRQALQASLPGYMVPAAFIELAALPLTANGKLDRRALPRPERAALFEHTYVPPQGELESALAEIWAQVLQVERVGRHDHFFERGGHSLLAMRMVSQLRQQLGVELPLGELFALGELAAVAQALAGAGRSLLPDIVPAPRDQALPASFGQQRLWFLAKMDGGNQAYNIALALSLRGALDSTALQHALNTLVQRHDTLRSRFVAAGQGAQVLTGAMEEQAGLHTLDLRAQPDGLTPWLREAAAAPFDLVNGPLLRASLLQLHEDYHVLALTVHHIVADGWSMGVLTEELLSLYRAFQQGTHNPLPPLAIQYGDYALWQRRWLTSERLQGQADYWQRTLDGAPALLMLPTDRPRPAQQDFSGASVAVHLGAELGAGLRALAQRQGVTLYTVLMSAWAALLARLSGQAEVVIGSPVAGRGRAELEAMVGLFVNTLAVRIDTAASPTGTALLAQAKARLLEAQDHQDLPFEQVVEIVRPARSLAHAPLFQTTLNWLPGQVSLPDLPGLTVALVEQTTQVAKFDLSLNLGEQGQALVGSLDYATALFDAATVQRYAGYFECLLQALVADEQVVLAQVALVNAQERTRLVDGLNATDRTYPQGHTVHAMVEAQALLAPEAIAAQAGDRSLTYGQLNSQANSLAHYLTGLGVRPDDRVAVVARRGLDTLVGLLAVLKAGGSYVPVDPAHPDERLQYLLDDSKPVLVLTQQALRPRIPDLGVPVLALDRPHWYEQPSNPQVPGLTERSLAYVIYTSGSTGQPKGVMVEHQTLNNLVHWHCQAFDLHAGSHTASVAGFGFDAMAWEVWPALCAGAVLHLPPAQDGGEDIEALLAWWREQPLDVSFLPTPVAEHAFNQGLGHPTLRVLLIGGDRLRQFSRDPGFAVINNYGPTEATVVATSGQLLPAGRLDIGRPIANTRVYLLDAHQQLVPQGVAGELYVGGGGVARGYLNRPELTAERFVRDPFSDEPRARLYRTGDLARWNADGTLEYLGRNDDQVKIRGVRVELGEIESLLGQLPGVETALVMAREDQPGQPRLVGYFSEQAGGNLSIGDLRAALLARLPAYMVPAALVRLSTWPLTANGKVDRRALPAPDREALFTGQYEAPETDIEQQLALIWAELLQVERVGRHDHFFELGGHSLLAVTLVSRLRQVGLEVDVGALFAQPTLAALAAAVATASAPPLAASLIEPGCQRITPALLPLVSLSQDAIDRIVARVPGGVGNVQDIYPLGPLQAGIFYHHLSAGDDDPYRLQARFAFTDEGRLQAFSAALQQVIERHDILRTALFWDDLPAPVQVVWRQAPLPMVKVPLEQLATLSDLDLAQAPLLRLVYAADPSNQRLVAVLQFHHVIMDHMALERLALELQAVLLGQEAQLPAPVPYRQYVAHSLGGLDDGAHEAYFREQLADIDEPTLPFGQPLSAQGTPDEARLTLDPTLGVRLREQSRHLGVSAASLVHMAWAQVLGHLCGRDRVVFGTVLLGRLQGGEGLDRALGVFINTLPLRLDLGMQSPRDAVLDTHRRLTGLLAHEHAPLALAQRCSALPAGTPLFSALLNYRHSAPSQPERGSAQAAWQGIELLHTEERSTYPLTLSVDDRGDGFDLTAQTAGGIEAQRICAYLDQALSSLLQALEQDEQTPVSELGVLPDAERQWLLEGFNAEVATWRTDLTIAQRIEDQALRHPHAIAAQVGDEALSYQALDHRANGLAQVLITQGVRPDDRVAVVARRGLDTLVGLLAVLKAGAGYVPVDPAHPDERLQYLLADSQPAAVLVQQALRGRLPGLDVPVLDLEGPWPQWPDSPTVPGLASTHLAYVIYTSGSTGQPKGVMVEHQTLDNLVDWHCQAFDLHAGSHTASVAGFGFDAMAWEVWPALCAGATLHLPPTDIGNEQLDALLDWWLAQPLQVAFLPTPVAEYAFSHQLRHPTLRTLLIGGDRLRQFNRDPGFAVINNYGPTEATVVASSGQMQVGGVLHIGKPITNARLYVLDERRQPVALGVPGELYVGGAGVARGYLNRPELTAERFLQDPFSPLPGARMYQTGDRVRWLADGTLEYLGRDDDQVKIRGVRVEPGEVERALLLRAGVGEAVVVAQSLEQGGPRLVAYFTRHDPALDATALRSHLQALLPEYMVPSAFVALEALPLTANGKVDRRALPAPLADAWASREYQAPVTVLETRLAGLWAALLEVERVGRHDSFFELGGHSLSAIRLVSQLRKAELPVTLAELFQHSSVAALAELLERRGAVLQAEPELVTVRAEGSEPPLFLVHDFTGLDAYFPVLAQHLGEGFPIHGLPGVGLGQPQLDTVPCLAARLVARIREVQPEGPYRLAGWSFGGIVAYEVATQLLGMDQSVGFLGLIDTYVPRLTDQGKARWQGPDLVQRQLLAHCAAYWQAQGEAGTAPGLLLEALAAQPASFEHLLQQCREQHLLLPELDEASDEQVLHYLAREVAHGHALAHYRLEPLNLPIHLFRAEQRDPQRADGSATLGWQEAQVTHQLHCIDVPGDHLSMMQAPHVQVLGKAIDHALATPQGPRPPSAYQPLLAIQSGQAAKAPLFCVPGAGDSVTSFIGLAEALGPDWPIYGVQARGLGGDAVPHSRVETAADCHVRAIEAQYPQGPLHLVGHSFGGWVAHAIAVRLQARGREVLSLTLVDTEAPGGPGSLGKPCTTTQALQRLVESLQLASGKPLGLPAQAFAEADDSTQLQWLHAAMTDVGLLPPRMAPQALHAIARTFASALRTVYVPQATYDGPASLVLVSDPTLDSAGNRREQAAMVNGWEALLPQLAVWEGPGNHFSVLKAPDVYSLAAWWYDRQAVASTQTLS